MADERRSGQGPEPVRGAASLFGAVVRPLQEFFALEAASGILLFAAAVIALAWANSPWQQSYHRLFATSLSLGIAGEALQLSLHQLIDDGLMTIFFFVVGMEIKRELATGELRTPRRAALPAVAALGGMIVPSVVFLAFNWGAPGQAGWGIPMATDIAFCIGCLTLLGDRVSHGLIVFLTALAIFDDVGGILVIAFFYGRGLDTAWLLGALGVIGGLFALNRALVRSGLAYAVGGAALWLTLHEGGIHATIAGVVLGLMVPARPRRPVREVLGELGGHIQVLVAGPGGEELDDSSMLNIEERLEELEAPLTRFLHALHPYVAFGIMPLFALANSGVSLGGRGVAELGGRVALGTALGLLVGKPIGIFAATALAVRAGLAPRPGGARWTQVGGVSVVAGIGFTVALFIAGLAYPVDPKLLDQARLGILIGSAAAGIAGILFIRATSPVRVITAPAPGQTAGPAA